MTRSRRSLIVIDKPMNEPTNPTSAEEHEHRERGASEVVEPVLDVAVDTVEAADLGCQIASCFDAMPDCDVIDCDPGCL